LTRGQPFIQFPIIKNLCCIAQTVTKSFWATRNWAELKRHGGQNEPPLLGTRHNNNTLKMFVALNSQWSILPGTTVETFATSSAVFRTSRFWPHLRQKKHKNPGVFTGEV